MFWLVYHQIWWLRRRTGSAIDSRVPGAARRAAHEGALLPALRTAREPGGAILAALAIPGLSSHRGAP